MTVVGGGDVVPAADAPAMLDEVVPAFTGVVRMEAMPPPAPRAIIQADLSGSFNGRRFLRPTKQAALDFVVLPNGIAGLAWDTDSRYPLEMSLSDALGRPFTDGPGDRSTLMAARVAGCGGVPSPAMRLVEGTVFASAVYDGYWHWHNDVLAMLPYLFDLEARLGTGPVRILDPWPDAPVKGDTMRAFGLPEDTIVQVAPGTVTRVCGTLIGLRRSTTLSPRRIREAFARMRKGAGVPMGGDGRLYISRADAAVRRVTNEAELGAALAALGFQTVVLSQLDYREKIRLFAGAELVVGPHGAGFCHIGFSAPGSTVIELFSGGAKWETRGLIARLAAAMGHRYGYVVHAESHHPKLDFPVDVARVVQALTPLLGGVREGAWRVPG